MKNKNRLFEMMSALDKKFVLKESVELQDINQILSGYIQAALFTEEERLNDEAQSEYDQQNDLFNDPDEDGDNELEKLIMISNNYKKKSWQGFSREDIEPNSLIKAYQDIKTFLKTAGTAVDEAVDDNGLERLGMDIWYVRNHHGAGFFDHSYDYDNEKILTAAAQSLGEVDLYINNNNKLSFGNEMNEDETKTMWDMWKNGSLIYKGNVYKLRFNREDGGYDQNKQKDIVAWIPQVLTVNGQQPQNEVVLCYAKPSSNGDIYKIYDSSKEKALTQILKHAFENDLHVVEVNERGIAV